MLLNCIVFLEAALWVEELEWWANEEGAKPPLLEEHSGVPTAPLLGLVETKHSQAQSQWVSWSHRELLPLSLLSSWANQTLPFPARIVPLHAPISEFFCCVFKLMAQPTEPFYLLITARAMLWQLPWLPTRQPPLAPVLTAQPTGPWEVPTWHTSALPPARPATSHDSKEPLSLSFGGFGLMPSFFLRQICRILDFGVEIQLPVFQWVLREREKGGEGGERER